MIADSDVAREPFRVPVQHRPRPRATTSPARGDFRPVRRKEPLPTTALTAARKGGVVWSRRGKNSFTAALFGTSGRG